MKQLKIPMSEAAGMQSLIDALREPRRYPHPVDHIRVVETHASWVLLTGTYAYKIKKPVDFGFLDFSTLALRRHFCEEELRINRRLAPALYLDVLPISGSAAEPRLGDASQPIEYALKMRQFDEAGLFDRLAGQHLLTPIRVRELGVLIASFHASAARLPVDSTLASAQAVSDVMLDNFHGLKLAPAHACARDTLAQLEQATRTQLDRLRAQLQQRRADGFVRECHGDLHLANITLHEGRVTLFDAIEFNEAFRWIDVISDLAFLLMDLEFRGEDGLANLALNTWLEFSGDADGLVLLPLYKMYRAMVRAKVSLLTAAAESLPADPRTLHEERFHAYLALAHRYTLPHRRFLLVTCGLSGSGKSHVSGQLAAQFGLIRLRSDVERKRLFGLAPLEASGPGLREQMYSPAASARTYQHLAARARKLLTDGQSVIVDAAFLRHSERDLFSRLAGELALPFAIVYCDAPHEQRRQWLSERSGDPSEATEALLPAQAGWFEPFTAEENTRLITVASGSASAPEQLAAQLRARVGAD